VPGFVSKPSSSRGEVHGVIRTTLVEVSDIDDFIDELDAAERTLRMHLAM